MIRLKDIQRVYPDDTVGIGGITFGAAEHSAAVLLGSSGSNRTTLMRMVNKMVASTSGAVLLAEKGITIQPTMALRHSVGYVLWDSGLFPHRRVIDDTITVPILDGTTEVRARERALELMGMVGLDRDLAGYFPSQLSGEQ